MGHIKKKIWIGMIVIALAIIPAEKVFALSIDELQARIAELTAQVDVLIKKVAALKTSTSGNAFLVDLQVGTKHSADVRRLQQFLIEKGYLAEGYDTGNFLSLTVTAIKQFQVTMGLPTTGSFDEKTRDKVNGLLNGFGNLTVTVTDNDGNTILIKKATSTMVAQTASTTLTDLVPTAGTYRIDPRPAYDIAMIERATFDAVNAERQKNGLSILQWNDQLADVARAHSSDQAGDNVKITNPDVSCLYPYIRHEGFVAGFRVGERLDNKNIPYSIAGENIIIFPITKDLIYRSEQAAPACKEFSDTEGPIGETQDAARTRIQTSLLERLSLMVDQQKLDWVNKQWKSTSELASESTIDWMNSPGHRHNILTPDFQDGAIGASIVNDYIIMTEVFRKPPAL